jgi:hypothetical protein
MPTFRIVYIDDDTFAPRTLTAAFADRAAAEIEMAKHGLRVVHLAEMHAGETAADPIVIPMAAACDVSLLPARPRTQERVTATQPLLGLPRYDLAGVAVVAAGIAMAGAAYLLF